MLVVNAAATAGEFYQTTISGLCPNTTYEFSAWVINLGLTNTYCGAGIIPINVRFEIISNTNTTTLASGDTGNISTTSIGNPSWNEYGLVFTTGTETSVILKMLNNGAGGCGNDLAIDDIEFKSCGDSISVGNTTNTNNVTICSNQIPYSTILNATPDNTVFTNHFYQWQESADNITWTDILGETNQSTTISGITTTMYYRSKVSESLSTINNMQCNTLSDIYQVSINQATIPTFNQVSPICNSDTLTTLPTTSNEGITGIWSPALNNTATTTYTFTPDSGQCATNQSMTIIVNPITNPTFTQILAICNSDTLAELPIISNEGITGTWSPALNNTTTTTYTFTPDSGQCAQNQTMIITVNPIITSTFNQVSGICSGDALAALPTTSIEGITGIWSPALNNTATTTYTFTPDSGQCATNQTMTISVNPITNPTFTQISAICNGDTLATLPTTSIEGVTGIWSPALNNTATTTYTFTPDSGQCAANQTMTISVNPNETPVFNPIPSICNGDTSSALPTTSNNGVTGTWSPALNNTTTTTYTFTPDPGFCPSTVNLTIQVNDNPIFYLQDEYFICLGINGNIVLPTAIETGLNTADYNFKWFLNTIEIVGADQATYTPKEEGNYTVIVQNTITLCESSITTLVTALYEPQFSAEVTTAPFSNNPIVEVTTSVIGDYEYKIDDGLWQNESVFYNVSIGEHIVAVRNRNGCIESTNNVFVIGYPQFFTPNNDGNNDTWNINSITNQLDAKIYIFNRYGKLLKQIIPSGKGWNGLQNGRLMPEGDYWFSLEYIDVITREKKQFSSHFSLKR